MIATLVVISSLILINALLIFLIKEVSVRFSNEVRADFLKRAERLGIFGEDKNEEQREEPLAGAGETEDYTLKPRSKGYVPSEKVPAEFKDENFKKNYKIVKSAFSYNREEFVKEFLANIQESSPEPSVAVKEAKTLKGKLNVDTVCQILSLERETQKEILFDSMEEQEQLLLKKYLEAKDELDLLDFIDYLDEFIELNDDTLYVRTGNPQDDFSDISPKVVTEYDGNIIEGIKIIHKNRMFDHSI